MRPNPFAVQRRRKIGPVSDIEDPAFRSAIIACASSGASRRTVAARMGKPESTIRGWIERGLAFPSEEPWGSFAVHYQQAERGIALAAAQTVAMRVQIMREQMEEFARWREDWKAQGLNPPNGAVPPAYPGVQDLMWLDRVLEARFPDDHGTSKHRAPETHYDPNNWLDANGMDREQLGALLCDPPESLRLAMADQAPAVYRILLATGFDPGAPIKRKADDDGNDEDDLSGDRATGHDGAAADDPG